MNTDWNRVWGTSRWTDDPATLMSEAIMEPRDTRLRKYSSFPSRRQRGNTPPFTDTWIFPAPSRNGLM